MPHSTMLLAHLGIYLILLPTFLYADIPVWRADNYPHPRNQYVLCKQNKPEWLCDPDGLLDNNAKDILNLVLEEMNVKYTLCPCSAWECESNSGGYYTSVILAKKIETGTNTSQAALLNNAIGFVSELDKRWSFKEDRCEEGIILFYSRDDNTLLTYSGKTARKVLTPELIREITEKAGQHFLPDENISVGLLKMVGDYRQVLNNHYVPQSKHLGGEELIGSTIRPLPYIFLHLFLLVLSVTLFSFLGN
ncbi:of levamisole receptor-1 domain-containing [Octopus vulgaris]|uniref:Of levamisole receptor-1 domain-containing n=1 Tax=Octopus vulgaris TaxID=6645 RepID=A0AA36BP47_OCTVU|nr:of levamisole receptor-1 domain-containing [Octopus vulgaris]